MRRLAQAITGLLALGLMLVYEPWPLLDCNPGRCNYDDSGTIYVYLLPQTLFLTVLLVVVTLVLVGVLGMRGSGTPAQAAVHAALGQSQRRAVAAAAQRGALDALVALGGAFVLTGLVHVGIVVASGHTWSDHGGSAWAVRGTIALWFSVALVAAHIIDAVRPRATPVERLFEDVAAPLPRRVSLRARTIALGGLAAAGFGVLVGVAASFQPGGANEDVVRTVAQGARITIALALVALFFAVGVPLTRAGIPPATRLSAKVTAALGAPNVTVIVRDRARTTSVASSRAVVAICGLAVLIGLLASADPAPALSPSYLGAVTFTPASAADALAAEYKALDGMGAVVLAPRPTDGATAAGVSPEEIAPYDPVLADLLRTHPGAQVANNTYSGNAQDELAAAGVHVDGVVPISTCCMAFFDRSLLTGSSDSAALLLYAAPGADLQEVGDAATNLVPDTDAYSGLGGSFVYRGEGSSPSLWGAVFTLLVYGALLAGPVIALAVGVAARRRRDDATLAALGASRRTLLGAGVVETIAVAAVAVGSGLLGGAVIHSLLAMVTRVHDRMDGVITDSYLRVAFGSVAWGALAWIYLGALAAFAVVAFIAGSARPSERPVEMLQSAEARGL